MTSSDAQQAPTLLLCQHVSEFLALSQTEWQSISGMKARGLSRSSRCSRVVHFSPQLLGRFNRRKRAIGIKWHMDETYIKVRGQWTHLYRAIDSVGDTVEFLLSENRDLLAAKRFFRKAFARHDRPERIVIDGSETNHKAIISCAAENRLRDRSRRSLRPVRIRKGKYFNNRIEQDHRRIKRRIRPMLGFKSMASAEIILSGMVHMVRKRQARFAYNPRPSIAEQFEILTARALRT
ncbi:IS6 family transposase [Mesorhizobium sp. KR1-2]|uniref:IS6 family transposase n=1 Tax=Mesorhizobium sp. KR1-2 TaxID=3156609 RepID=UPI0032B31317